MANQVEGALFFNGQRGVFFANVNTMPKARSEWIMDFSEASQYLLAAEEIELIKKLMNMISLRKKLEAKSKLKDKSIQEKMVDVSVLFDKEQEE